MVKSALALPATPSLVVGTVTHARLEKIHRKFQHKTYQWLVDLDNLPLYPWYLRPFTTFNSQDHLGDAKKSIRENVDHFLESNDIKLAPSSRILMLANARILGHSFDPLTVFWCVDKDDYVTFVLAEVRNTYHQRHLYILSPDSSGKAMTQKRFHVSPFLDVSGHYEMRFTLTSGVVSTTVTLLRGESASFSANFRGQPIPATQRAIFQLFARPFMTQRISILIRIHGIWLWLGRLPVFQLPHHDPQEGV